MTNKELPDAFKLSAEGNDKPAATPREKSAGPAKPPKAKTKTKTKTKPKSKGVNQEPYKTARKTHTKKQARRRYGHFIDWDIAIEFHDPVFPAGQVVGYPVKNQSRAELIVIDGKSTLVSWNLPLGIRAPEAEPGDDTPGDTPALTIKCEDEDNTEDDIAVLLVPDDEDEYETELLGVVRQGCERTFTFSEVLAACPAKITILAAASKYIDPDEPEGGEDD